MDISEILSNLSADDINNLKNAASSILGNGIFNKNEEKIETGKDVKSNALMPEAKEKGGFDIFNPELFEGIASVFSTINREDDRCRFLLSLRPMLSEGRRSRADEAVKFLKLLNVVPLLRDRGIL
ncbi:MAG: hypothetical protein FWF08_05050 [Oscillospiraceae bacterium]|nr:hypothetical protein [Oscillospiraceae bacterium]